MNICLFGDSITWGGYDPQNGGWGTLLRNYLEAKYGGVATYNLGICADDSMGLLKRFWAEATPRNPDLLLFAIGVNDVKHQPNQPVTFAKFQQNISELIFQALQFTKNILILGITSVDESLNTPRSTPPHNFRENADIQKCNRILKEVAIKNQLAFIPIPANFSNTDLADGLHPNTEGHLKIFEAVKPVVDHLISKSL